MASQYIVVSAPNAEITKIAIGMLGAQYLTQEPFNMPYAYPMPGPTFFVWPGAASVDGTQVAFGPFESGLDEGFGAWCLGRELEFDDNGLVVSVTIPSTSQELESTWFAPPV